MGDNCDQVMKALRSCSEELAPVVRALSDDQLTGPSAAAEWDLSQVLGHLGSGAVITQARLEAALAGQPTPDMDANRAVWARWDAMTARERADGFLAADAALLAAFDAVDAPTRENLRIDMGFLPAPVDVVTVATFRLNELALHSWDVRVMQDASATLHPDAAPLLLDQVGFTIGWLAKGAAQVPDTVSILVTLSDLDRSFGLSLGPSPSLGPVPANPDVTVVAPAEAWMRLVSGRLPAKYTPSGVGVSGQLGIDALRAVFPGY